MNIIEDLHETRLILEEQRNQGKTIRLFVYSGVPHQAKAQLLDAAKEEGIFLCCIWGHDPEKVTSSCAILDGADLFHPLPSTSLSGGKTYEEVALRLLVPDEIVCGEKDFPRLRRVESLCERAKPKAVRVIRAGISRDVDGLPIGARTEELKAIERFQARFIPQSLRKTQEIFRSGEQNVETLLGMTQENLEKSQGLEILEMAFYSGTEIDPENLLPRQLHDKVNAGDRLQVHARAGTIEVRDNIEMVL